MATLLSLPVELTLHILWFLDLEDIIACQLTYRSLYVVIKSSVLLKYLRALKVAGMEDNRLCTALSMPERLNMLNLREDAWATQLIDFSRTISIPMDTPFRSSYGFNGGISFFIERGLLHYFSFPFKASEEIHWCYIDPHGRLEAVGFAIYEHDLIAMVVSFQNRKQICILLFEASTGKPHPLAQSPRIPVSVSRVPISVDMGIKIVGDHLALVTISPYAYWDELEWDLEWKYVDIYDWKSGTLKMTTMVEEGCQDVLFLSPKVLLIPNPWENTFELWNIPELPDPKHGYCPNGALALPPLKDRWSISRISCQCAPSFGLHSTRYSSIPFYASAADAIAVFSIHATFDNDYIDFSMIVHLRSLLDLYATASSLPERVKVPWDKWGPSATRLCRMNSVYREISSTDSSDRCVFSSTDGETIILDFNPARIYSRIKKSALSVITGAGLLDIDCFKNPVTSRLPYIRQIFPNTGAFRGVFIDGERLVGLRYDENAARVEALKIWHIGAPSVIVPQTES